MSDVSDDRRSHPRAPIELKVEYKKLNTFFYDYTKNISRGGSFIKTTRPLDIGTPFLFKLVVPQLDEPVVLHGVVKWVVTARDASSSGKEPGMGIEFIYENREEELQVERIVEALMVDELGTHAFKKLMGR